MTINYLLESFVRLSGRRDLKRQANLPFNASWTQKETMITQDGKIHEQKKKRKKKKNTLVTHKHTHTDAATDGIHDLNMLICDWLLIAISPPHSKWDHGGAVRLDRLLSALSRLERTP